MTLHPMTEAASLQALLDSDLFAPWVRELGLKVDAAERDAVHFQLPIAPRHVHGGGVLCGQTMMAAADTAMVVAISAAIGGFKPMTTVQLQTSFLRPIAGDAGAARVVARVLRMGRKLVFGEVHIRDAGGELAAHATTTYALV